MCSRLGFLISFLVTFCLGKKKGNDDCSVDGQRQDLVLGVTRPYEVEFVSLPGVKMKNHK